VGECVGGDSWKIAGKEKRDLPEKLEIGGNTKIFSSVEEIACFLGWWNKLCIWSGRITFGFDNHVRIVVYLLSNKTVNPRKKNTVIRITFLYFASPIYFDIYTCLHLVETNFTLNVCLIIFRHTIDFLSYK
jgi:hypothetical protein